MAVEIYRDRAIFVTVKPADEGGYVPHVQLGSVTHMEKGPPKTRAEHPIPIVHTDSFSDEETAFQHGLAIGKRVIDSGGYRR